MKKSQKRATKSSLKNLSSKVSITKKFQKTVNFPSVIRCYSCAYFCTDQFFLSNGYKCEIDICGLNHKISANHSVDCRDYLLGNEEGMKLALNYIDTEYDHNMTLLRFAHDYPEQVTELID
jgi:hypothetical protein